MKTPREQLADTLRTARLEAGYSSHAALASAMHVSRSLVSKAENPREVIPSDAALTAWSGVTGCPLDQLTELAKRCRSGTPDWFVPYRAAEADATVIRSWAPLIVSGLEQTEGYARAVLAAEPCTPEQLDGFLATRLERQAVLGRAVVTSVLDHTVLQRLIGTSAIMAEQCAHLAELAERPNVALHVLPEGANPGCWGALDIASSDGLLVTVNLSTAVDDIPTTSTGLADKALRAFERVLGCALPRPESLGYVREMEETWKARI